MTQWVDLRIFHLLVSVKAYDILNEDDKKNVIHADGVVTRPHCTLDRFVCPTIVMSGNLPEHGQLFTPPPVPAKHKS